MADQWGRFVYYGAVPSNTSSLYLRWSAFGQSSGRSVLPGLVHCSWFVLFSIRGCWLCPECFPRYLLSSVHLVCLRDFLQSDCTGILSLTIGFVFVSRFDLHKSCSFVSCSIPVLELKLLISSKSEVSASEVLFQYLLPLRM